MPNWEVKGWGPPDHDEEMDQYLPDRVLAYWAIEDQPEYRALSGAMDEVRTLGDQVTGWTMTEVE